jgi:hypothetical protein
MAYSYNFDEDSPCFALSSLWFLLGVIVFAFSVLAMASIVTYGGSDGTYLNVQQQQSQELKPAVNRNNVPQSSSSTRTDR